MRTAGENRTPRGNTRSDHMQGQRPLYRPAQIVTEAQGDAEIASGDPERMRLALTDASRCLDDAWSLRHAIVLSTHSDAGVRWAAMFALDQVRGTWEERPAEEFFDVLHLVKRVVADDPDHAVRRMAATVLCDVVGDLFNST